MPAKKKLVSHAAQLVRDAMVTNLSAWIQARYPNVATSTAYEKIASRTGSSLSTLQRIMSGDTGPSIDTLADLAHHLGTSVSELLQVTEDHQTKTPPPQQAVQPPPTQRARTPRELQRR